MNYKNALLIYLPPGRVLAGALTHKSTGRIPSTETPL